MAHQFIIAGSKESEKRGKGHILVTMNPDARDEFLDYGPRGFRAHVGLHLWNIASGEAHQLNEKAADGNGPADGLFVTNRQEIKEEAGERVKY